MDTEKEVKHTPGPWEIPHTDKEIKQTLICSGGIPIKANAEKFGEKCALFLLPVNETFGNEDIAIANARLIAAAPDLLEALRMQELVYFAENEIYDCRQRESIARSYEQKRAAHDKLLEAQKLFDIYQDKASEMRRNAIAKAEGK